MTPGEQSEPRRAHLGRGRGRVLALLAVLPTLGCQSTPRSVDPDSRKFEPPPFAYWYHGHGPGAETSPADDGGTSAGESPGPAREGDRSPAKDVDLDEDEDDADGPESWPNVQDPGPDMANFPNSAYTIPRNAVHIEFAPLVLSGPTDTNGANYNTQFLLRYGLTDRMEFRIFGIGFVDVFTGREQTTGFSPIAFDLKTNLWRESKNHLIPATGLEVYIQSEFGSPVLRRSGVQPAMSLLFDHTLPLGFNFEWNVGLNGAQRPLKPGGIPSGPINLYHGPEEDSLEWNLQWALQHRFFNKLDVFTHGFINGSAVPNIGDGIVVGGGGVYTVNERLCLFGSYNSGLTLAAASTFLLVGFAYAL